MKPPLTTEGLIAAARSFCAADHTHPELFGATDGKAVGTFVELRFRARAVWPGCQFAGERRGHRENRMTQLRSLLAEAVTEYLTEPGRADLLDVVARWGTYQRANDALQELTGITSFFPDHTAFVEFRRLLALPAAVGPPEPEWGDFQTPPRLAAAVCACLAESGVAPRVIVEPTYGTGTFIQAALQAFPHAERVYGVEIQDRYAWHLKLTLLQAADILVLGNPPWVTNAELGTLAAGNVPVKRNIKALNGLAARTGKSNFDLAEYILLRLLELFSEQRGTLALLCKNSVIRNLVELLPRRPFKIANIRAYGIDAQQEFGAAVDAPAQRPVSRHVGNRVAES